MKEKIKIFFSFLILLLALPFLITWVMQGEAFFQDRSQNSEEEVEKLVGILAMEIPVDYEEETIKAQAVIARTNLSASEAQNTEEPKALSREEMMKLWGEEKFIVYYDFLKKCIEETEGNMIYYEGKPVFIPYHAVSAGYTRTALESFGQKNRSYLKSVKSMQDVNAEKFLKVEYFDKTKIAEVFQQENPEIEILSRDEGGYVIQIQVADQILSGEEFRNRLGLNSSCFSIEEERDRTRIVTKGLGHGLGFSQFGANELAKQGKTFKELLNYYISEIEIIE